MKQVTKIEPLKDQIRLKPFIRWAGGKQNLIKEIFETAKIDKMDRYFEPFLGGASFFLYGSFLQSFLSDLNPQINKNEKP